MYPLKIVLQFSLIFWNGIGLRAFSEDSAISKGYSWVANVSADSPAGKAIENAKIALANRDLVAARECLKPLGDHPSVAHPEIVLAQILIASGDHSSGRSILDAFSGLEPSRLDLFLASCDLAVREKRWFDGWILANLSERAIGAPHWGDEYRKTLTEQISRLKGACCEGRSDWKGALNAYTSISNSESESNAEVFAGLGRSCFHLNDIESALKHFARLKELKPESDPPQLLLARLYDQSNRSAEADEAFQTALSTAENKDLVRVRLVYARWLIANGAENRMDDLLVKPIEESEEDETERLFLLATVARIQGRLEEGQQILTGLQRKYPNRFVISNQLAIILSQTSDESLRARSLQIAESNVRGLPQSGEAWATLGWVKHQLGELDAAEKCYAKSSQLGPLSRDTLYYIWQLKKSTNDPQAPILEKAFRDAKGPNYFGSVEVER